MTNNETHDLVYIYEGAQARLERSNKRLWILAVILIAALLLTNIGWVIYESQYQVIQETTTTVEQDNENGYNNYIGNDGDIIYGETNNNNEDG